MTVEELRNHLYEIISGYFSEANVIWGEQNSVNPKSPFVRLKLSSIRRPQHFIMLNGDNNFDNHIPSTAMLEVELFTNGRVLEDENGDTYAVNTALDDMADFVNYMVSYLADDLYYELNISIRPEGDILDTSAVLDSDYQYRALQEFVVDFTQTTKGYAGIFKEDYEPSSSGGGTEELADMPVYYIEHVDVQESKEE